MQLLGKCLHTTVAPPPPSLPDQCLSGFVHLPSMFAPTFSVCTLGTFVSIFAVCIIPLLTYLSTSPHPSIFYRRISISLSCHHCLLHPFQQVIKILIAAIHLQDDPTHRFEALICHSNSVVLWLQHAHLIAPRSSCPW